MEAMGRTDLMDRFDAVLPRVNPADEAGEILRVMARICRAPSAAVFFERGGALLWIAGDSLSDDVAAAISVAWRAQHRRVLTGTAFTESGGPEGETPSPWRLMWIRRPEEDGGLDAVYFAGPDLRPLEICSRRLIRLVALLGRLH
jgi:hypothetical protein